MSKIKDTMRRVVGSGATAPTGPALVDLKAEYMLSVSGFIAAARRYNGFFEAYPWQMRLNVIRARAVEDGHGERLAAVWIDPPSLHSPAVIDWYEAKTNHVLHGGADPGMRPWHPQEWEYWVERYRDLAARFVHESRTGQKDPEADAGTQILRLPQEAMNNCWQQYGKISRRLGPPINFVKVEPALSEWEVEVAYRLEHGEPSGTYVPPPSDLPPPFKRQVASSPTYSAVVLLAQHGAEPVGSRVHLDAAISWELTENGKAVWCEPTNIPADPREPIERAPEAGWQEVRCLRPVRLRSRHRLQPGDLVTLPPDEAAELVDMGAAELWVEPLPPPLPPILTVFGDANE